MLVPELAGDVHQGAFDVGHREEHPLVLEGPLVRSERRDQTGVEMLVGEVEDEAGGFEDGAVVRLEHRRAAERVECAVLGRLLCLARHDREVEWDAELLEEPEHARRPGAWLMMKSHRSILAAAPAAVLERG